MTNQINLIPLRDGLARLLRSKSTYYSAINPTSANYDPDLPRTIAMGSAPNAPRAFVECELQSYIEKLVARARNAEGQAAQAQAAQAHAQKLVTARRTRRAASEG